MMMKVANTTPIPRLTAIGTRNCACRLRSMISGNTPRNVVSVVSRIGLKRVLAPISMAS